jgi:RND superfamily putative drug exporter
MIAMAGMLFAGDKTYLSFGIATMLVVAVAMLGSLTVLPALLSKLGDRIEKGRIPYVGRLRRERGENRFWSAILTPALKHPLVSAIAATAVLLVMAVPVLSIHTAQTGLDALPKSIATVETIEKIQDSFPGSTTPALVAIKANADAPATKAAIEELRSRALASGQMQGPIEIDVNAAAQRNARRDPAEGQRHRLDVDGRARHAPNTILPATVGKLDGASYAVTAEPRLRPTPTRCSSTRAVRVRVRAHVRRSRLLLISFRSIVIAGKAIVLNLLSVGAAYGVPGRNLPVRLG